MAAVARKLTPEPQVTDYAQAHERWRKYLQDRQDADQAVKAARAAVRAAAGGFKERRARITLEAAEELFADLVERLPVERAAWDAARGAEAEAVARRLQPRHREAVKAIGKALEVLSDAIRAECEVRAQFLATGLDDGMGSVLLPDASSALMVGTLDDYGSIVSQWNRRMLSSGVLA